jgi:hypothetical protein
MLSSTPGGGYAARPVNSILDRFLHGVRSALRKTNSRLLGVLARSVDLLSQPFRKKYLPLNTRALISLSQPIDPLRRARDLPGIELVIPFVEKDLRALPIVLETALKNIRNPVAQVTLITPKNAEGSGPRFSHPESSTALSKLLADMPQVRLVYDQDLLGAELLDKLQARFGEGDRNAGWVMQQLIKLSAALQSRHPGALILDSDTVLLTPKTWLNSSGRQLLQIAIEYHSDFMRHVEMFFGVPKKHRLSFITHHQLMQPDVVREMFPDGQKSLIAWWESSTDPIGRDLGDYEAYGSFLAHHHPHRVSYGSFGNLFSPALDQFLYDLETSGRSPQELIPDYCSVSFHSWAQVPREASDTQPKPKEETPK